MIARTGTGCLGTAAIEAVHAGEHALLRSVRGDLTAGDVEACPRVLARLLETLDDVDVDQPVPPAS